MPVLLRRIRARYPAWRRPCHNRSRRQKNRPWHARRGFGPSSSEPGLTSDQQEAAKTEFLNRRSQRGIAATTEGDRIGVSAYGRTGEKDVVKPLSPERNPRENARSSTSALQRFQRGDSDFLPSPRISSKLGRFDPMSGSSDYPLCDLCDLLFKTLSLRALVGLLTCGFEVFYYPIQCCQRILCSGDGSSDH